MQSKNFLSNDHSSPIDDSSSSNRHYIKKIPAMQIISNFSSLVFSKENIPNVICAVLLTGLSTVLNFLSPYILGKTVNLLTSNEKTTFITEIELSPSALITLLVTTHALSKLIPNIRDQTMILVTTNNTKKMITRSFEHLLKKSLDHHINTPFSDHMYLIQKAVAIGAIGTPLLTQIVPTIIEITIACFLLSNRYGIEIAAVLGVLLSLNIIYGAFTAKSLIHAREEVLKVDNEAQENFSSMIACYKIMRDFGQLNYTMTKTCAILDNLMKADSRLMAEPLRHDLGHILLSYFSMLITFLYVGLSVKSGRYCAHEFVTLVSYLTQLTALLSTFGRATSQLFASYPDLNYVFTKLAESHEVVDLNPETPLLLTLDVAPFIEFDKVTFHHMTNSVEPEKTALFDNLSFKISAGQTVAFVSKSGSGKTTIFNLLYGYYQPSKGTIKINGQDISKVSSTSLEKNIAIFAQNPNLFNATIRENICYGSENPHQVIDEEIWSLAKSVNLDHFLTSFSEQLDTKVGEDGKALSGGQQQKVAILRGLIKTAPIRLFDEITAPLDNQSASQILESLKETSNGITTLMITHKLTEAQSVDKLIVLDQGRVIAEGRHRELLETCSLYQELWDAYTIQDSRQALATPIANSSSAESSDVIYSQITIHQRTLKTQNSNGLYSRKNDVVHSETAALSSSDALRSKLN